MPTIDDVLPQLAGAREVCPVKTDGPCTDKTQGCITEANRSTYAVEICVEESGSHLEIDQQKLPVQMPQRYIPLDVPAEQQPELETHSIAMLVSVSGQLPPTDPPPVISQVQPDTESCKSSAGLQSSLESAALITGQQFDALCPNVKADLESAVNAWRASPTVVPKALYHSITMLAYELTARAGHVKGS